MTKLFLVLSLLLANPVDAKGLPIAGGHARWDTGVICPPGRSGKQCDEYEATLNIWHMKGEFCGSVDETTERKSPVAWFRGRPFKEGILVRYVDSFQHEPDTFGWAVINVHGKRLSWTVLTMPEGGYTGSESRFRLENDLEHSDGATGSCDELEKGQSGLTVRLPPSAEGPSN